ncbi:MAG TPA: tRNA (adenosine(37)-N6)-dimethylallyltransferase MiaA [Cytophagales bacterium]|jgi:tRNA dimethylallyltransferase|nr:tRNA (adenosine(37)-N6)-dimethylallyltransferase MiaA [Cytophagales bacterium]
MKVDMITITGPTASGKTGLAAHLAHELNTEIISADSRQVYREMDIGTGKDLEDYLVDGHQVPYHLIDFLEPGYKYNVFEYQKDFLKAFETLRNKGKPPILAGGTGMYIEAVLKGYRLIDVPPDDNLRSELQNKSQEELVGILRELNPELHNTTDTEHKKRTIRAIEIARYYKENPTASIDFPKIDTAIIGVKYDRPAQKRKISARLKQRLEEGMIEEVEKLLEKVPSETLVYYGLEYKFITHYLQNTLSYDKMFKKLEVAIHQFAKRQMTWFRKMERQGWNIHWIDGHMPMEQKLDRAFEILDQYGIKK